MDVIPANGSQPFVRNCPETCRDTFSGSPSPSGVISPYLACEPGDSKISARGAMRPVMGNDERRIATTGLTRLLARLDPDSDRAAAEYERLRLALEKFFDWRGAWPPDECADETLDRLARKLEAETDVGDVRGYAYGIARLVLLEWRRRPAAVPIDAAGRTLAAETAVPGDDEPLRDCFDRCLAELPPESRTLVLEYYVAERRTKIDNRRRLARIFGISESALRSRVQRVRDRLERCVHTCTTLAEAGITR